MSFDLCPPALICLVPYTAMFQPHFFLEAAWREASFTYSKFGIFDLSLIRALLALHNEKFHRFSHVGMAPCIRSIYDRVPDCNIRLVILVRISIGGYFNSEYHFKQDMWLKIKETNYLQQYHSLTCSVECPHVSFNKIIWNSFYFSPSQQNWKLFTNITLISWKNPKRTIGLLTALSQSVTVSISPVILLPKGQGTVSTDAIYWSGIDNILISPSTSQISWYRHAYLSLLFG